MNALERADKRQIDGAAAHNILSALALGLQEGAWLSFTVMIFLATGDIRWEKDTDPEPQLWQARVALAEYLILMESWSHVPFVPKEIVSPSPVWNPMYPWLVLIQKHFPNTFLLGKKSPGVPYKEFPGAPMTIRIFTALMIPWFLRWALDHMSDILGGLGAIAQGVGQIVPG